MYMLQRPMLGDTDVYNIVGMRFRCPDGCGTDVTLHFGKPADGHFSWDRRIDDPSLIELIVVPTCEWRGYLRGATFLTEFESTSNW